MSNPKKIGFVAPATLADMPRNTPVLLALSGGADSRALLHFLVADADENGYSLTLAHVNHGIRGGEALRDRAFCEALAKQYGLELCVLDVDLPLLARERGIGLEEAGRAVRYDYFARLMAEREIPLLATAHHADDQLETILFRLARGTGLGGLTGIAPCRPFASGFLTRPLLGASKKSILNYCKANDLQFVIDSTNVEAIAARNRIRAEVVPILEQLFDGPQDRVTAMTETLREDEALLSEMANELLTRARVRDALSIESLKGAHASLQRRALAMWCREQTLAEPERVHVEALMRLLQGETPRAAVALPQDFCAYADMGWLLIERREEMTKSSFRLPLIEGETRLAGGVCVSVKKVENSAKVHNMYTQSCIMIYECSDLGKRGFYWRSREAGDTLLCNGMHKQLRKLYREARIPVRWRDRLPVLCDEEGIVWAPFVGCRDHLNGKGEAWLLTVALPIPAQKEQEKTDYESNGARH